MFVSFPPLKFKKIVSLWRNFLSCLLWLQHHFLCLLVRYVDTQICDKYTTQGVPEKNAFWGEANHLTNRNFFGTPDTIYVQWVSFFKITMLVIIYIYINTTLNNLLNWPYLLFLSLYEGLSKHQSLYLSSTAIWEFEPVDYFLIKAKKYVKLKILIVLSSPIASSFPIFSQSKTWKTIVLFIISLLAT